MGYGKGSPKGEIHSHPSLPQKSEKSGIHQLSLHLKELENQQQITPTPCTRREIINISAEINELETRDKVEQINETGCWFLERINKIEKPLAKLIQKKRERTQINKIMNERGEVMTNTKEMETIIRNYCQQLYANKLSNLEEMDTFLET